MGREWTSVGKGRWGNDVPLRGCGCRGCYRVLFFQMMSLVVDSVVDLVVVVVVVVGIQVRE